MALLYALSPQRTQTLFKERPSYPAPANGRSSNQVMDQPPAPVMATEDGANNFSLMFRNETQANVPPQELANGFGFIGTAQPNTRSGFP